MRDRYNNFKGVVKRYGWRVLICSLGLLLIAGIVADNLPGSRGWFHDMKWDLELKGRSAWAKITSSDFDLGSYPGEGSPQAIELQRKIDEWYPQALERYPRFQVQYKNVQDDRNGFLKIIEWQEEFELENIWDAIPEKFDGLLEMRKGNGSASPELLSELETYLKTKQDLLDRALVIGLLSEQSVKNIPSKRYIFTSVDFVMNIINHLKLKVILEAGRGDAAEVMKTLTAIRGWINHYSGIETPSLIFMTLSVAIQNHLNPLVYSMVLPNMELEGFNYDQGAKLLNNEIDRQAQWVNMWRGEWHSCVKALLPMELPHVNLRDPIECMEVYSSFMNDLADPKQIEVVGLSMPPPPEHLTVKSRALIELLDLGISAFGDGFRRSMTLQRQYEVAFTLRKLEAEGQDLSSLKEAATKELGLQVLPDIRLSIDFDKRLVSVPEGKGMISDIEPLAF